MCGWVCFTIQIIWDEAVYECHEFPWQQTIRKGGELVLLVQILIVLCLQLSGTLRATQQTETLIPPLPSSNRDLNHQRSPAGSWVGAMNTGPMSDITSCLNMSECTLIKSIWWWNNLLDHFIPYQYGSVREQQDKYRAQCVRKLVSTR